jgi:hypothetical protein
VRRTKQRRAAAVLAAVAIGAAPLALDAEPAPASATKCVSGSTSYCAYVNGSGLQVNYVTGSFTSVSSICNWTITAEFFDSSGRWYKTFESGVRSGCTRSSSTKLTINYKAKAGRMYSTLRSNGRRVTSVSFSIHL